MQGGRSSLMHMENSPDWKWIWPHVGAAPVSQGLDSEMFDRVNFPYSETFVREAIQNSLDARLSLSEPVRIHFTFHEDVCGQRKAFLANVIKFREKVELEIPEEWSAGRIKWLVVEDFNSKGLSGPLTRRTSNFWNYWLNFGLSNKDGSGRGGRGIGRVTFLIASRLQSVIGYTRRSKDGASAVCGMSVLRPQRDGNNFLSTHAYLAREENDSIYRLHNSEHFHEQIRNAFCFTGYDQEFTSGLALAIPYPHDDLVPEGILAAAIENFAPAIMSGTLVLNVDGKELNASTIVEIAEDVSGRFNDEAIKTDVKRYLHLINRASEDVPEKIKWIGSNFDDLREMDVVKSMQERLDNNQDIVLNIELPLVQNDNQMDVTIKAIIATTPLEKKPLDRLFRGGMSLPEVRTRSPGELDLILMVEDKQLTTYLNFCEGKAHLNLLESKEIAQRLSEKGYSDIYKVKRLVKNLPENLRTLLAPEISEPVADVFIKFFSIPGDEPAKKPLPKEPGPNDDPDDPIPPPRISPFQVDDLRDGLRVRGNPEYTEWPVNLTVTLAYADGSRRPSWSEFDFRLEHLSLRHEDCHIKTKEKNKIRALGCGPECSINVTGFDTNRELDTSIRWDKDAQEN